MSEYHHHLITIITLAILIPSLFFVLPKPAHASPLLANYFLGWEITSAQVPELAKWDLLILDMETQVNSRTQLQKIKELNPDIILLAYVTAQEIKTDGTLNYSVTRKKLAAGIPDSWYLVKGNGEKISFYPGTTMLNPADTCPVVNGYKWNTYLANFIASDILSTGIWSGVFYDNAWPEITWFTNDVDYNRDGVSDTNINARLQAGYRELFSETRRLTGGRYYIVGNSFGKQFKDELNGIMLEGLQNRGWTDSMQSLQYQNTGSISPRINVLNTNNRNVMDSTNYRLMRFGLASSLMQNSYYSFDYGDQNHAQTWWYDEYTVALGSPSGESQEISNKSNYAEGVWRRDFSNGIALVNSGSDARSVDLGGDYEKIVGKQDPQTNNGLIVDKVNIPGKDGLLLMKTTQSLTDTVFLNGYFVRFFDAKGNRARNGFFAFSEGAPGGAKVFLGDLDGDQATQEKIVVAGPKFQIFNGKNEIWYEDYPYGTEFTGGIRLAVGKIYGTDKKEILIAPSPGNRAALYTYYGGTINTVFYPLGKKFKNGLAVAIGNTDGGTYSEAIVGTGTGVPNEILIYDYKLTKIRHRFFPYGNKYTSGISIASGDVNGDSKDEIITAGLVGGKNLIRVFDATGKKLSEFYATGLFGGARVTLSAGDINFDGKDEIVVMNK